MKLEFELNAHTALGILEALEVFTSHDKKPQDPDDEFYFDQLILLRDLFREQRSNIQTAASKRNPNMDLFVP
jgi:ribosomal 30S subunit maturation factor RimM